MSAHLHLSRDTEVISFSNISDIGLLALAKSLWPNQLSRPTLPTKCTEFNTTTLNFAITSVFPLPLHAFGGSAYVVTSSREDASSAKFRLPRQSWSALT